MNVNMVEILDVILRALISLIALFSVTKLLGKNKCHSYLYLIM